MNPVELTVLGVPAPQGSKRAFVANGRAVVKEAGGTHALWRNQVAAEAKAVANGAAPLDGPLGLSIEFRFPMPASRSKTARTLGRSFKTTAPDIDKLVRSICDGLQAGGLITDDARFCAIEACKVEVTSWTGAAITITREETP